MHRLPRHLSASLLCGLLWANGFGAHARELRPSEPLRVTLVSLARQASPAASNPSPKLSVRRAWASDTRAQLCALTMDAQGQPVFTDGRFELRRVRYERHQAAWRVQRIDTAWLAAGASLDSVCPGAGGNRNAPAATSPATQLAKRAPVGIDVAIAEMSRNPPTAGRDRSMAHCKRGAASSQVADVDLASWPAGKIAPSGRSHLFAVPDRACPMGKHLVRNDRVRIGATRQGWTQVRYTHPITNVVTVGWLPRQKVAAAEVQVASATP